MTNKDSAPPQDFFIRVSGTGEGIWELDRPQSTIVQLVKHGIFKGNLLDLGCGNGDNAIYIATHSKNVNITAFDLVKDLIISF
jgi:2-polyprenyl-3-methyl-5-hydroxy-6-metoxy-1,4-benzoquinol methylase